MRFFTADTHFAHKMIIHPDFVGRQFATLEEHDQALLAGINATVERNDELYILGDFCWARPGKYRAAIKCRKVHLIWGNHDKESYGIHFSLKEDVMLIKCRRGDETIQMFLSHYPHAHWPASHHGSVHLYGHVHDAKEAELDFAFPDRRSMDCGMDTAKRLIGNYVPFSEDQIMERLLVRPGHGIRVAR